MARLVDSRVAKDGDTIATRFNPAEQMLTTVLMLGSAFLWGQVVATFCSLVASMAEGKMAYRATLVGDSDSKPRAVPSSNR